MSCKKCNSQNEAYGGFCYTCILGIRNRSSPFVSECPNWFANFSNKVMPPFFFLALAILSFHFLTITDSLPLQINLGVVSVASSSLGLYLGTLFL